MTPHPIISIIVTTYNQEKYIAECLDSILMQKECPPFEILIGNDHSSDGTAAIILTYASRHPSIITVFNRQKNLGMQKNLKDLFERAKGNYIAICEGDDYWIDAYKLKKQYQALKQDRKAVICFNNIQLLQDGKILPHIPKIKSKFQKKITASQLIKFGNPIGNFSCCMYKKEALNLIPIQYYEHRNNADFLFHLHILDKSPYAIYLKKPMSIYRIITSSMWHSINEKERFLSLTYTAGIAFEIFKSKYINELYDFVPEKVPFHTKYFLGWFPIIYIRNEGKAYLFNLIPLKLNKKGY